MSNGVNTIQAANNGITSITKLVQSAQALISQAQQTANATVRASLAGQFDALRTQIDTLSADAGFNGINLLGGNNLTVTLNETGTSSVTITGVTYNAAGLAISASANAWVADADIQAASVELTAALTTLRSQAQSFSTNLSTVQIRQEFTKSMINTLQTGADALTLADSNEEGANLLALQTRQQLSTTALSLASQAAQSVLRLFQ
jgi:flagellin-like hook-associated protein FlgL